MSNKNILAGDAVRIPAQSKSQYGTGENGEVVRVDGNLVYVEVGYHDGSSFVRDTIQFDVSEVKK